MAYKKWNRRKMRAQQKYLKTRYDFTKDERFLFDAQCLKDILAGKVNPFSYSLSFNDQMVDDAAAIDLYYDFLDDICDFARVNTKKFDDIKVFEADPIGNLTPSLLFSFLKEFFYEFDKEFGTVFDYIHEERFNNLMFSSHRSISFHVPSLKYSYINITKNDTVVDFLNSVHEYTHSIVDYLCYRESEGAYPFCELVSLFMELIAADYMCEIYSGMEDDLNTIRLAGAKNICIFAENISIEKDYFYAYDGYEDRKFVEDTIYNETGKSYKYIDEMFEKSAMEKLSYTIPYLTAIELYYLYKEDKKKCVDLIKYLMFVTNKENYNVDLNDNGILLNQHSEEWIDTLIKRKKSLK